MIEPTPTLDIYRPVKNLDPSLADEFERRARAAMKMAGFSKNALRSLTFNTGPNYKTSSVFGGAILRFMRINGQPISETTVSGIAEYLDTELPDSVDENIYAPVFPSVVHATSERKRWINVGACDDLAKESAIVQSTISEFYAQSKPLPDSWEEYPECNGIKLVTTNYIYSDEVADVLQETLHDMAKHFPATIEYGPLVIEDARR